MSPSPSAFNRDETSVAARIVATPSHQHVFSEMS